MILAKHKKFKQLLLLISFLLFNACSSLKSQNANEILDPSYQDNVTESAKSNASQFQQHRFLQQGSSFSYEGPIQVLISDNFAEHTHEKKFRILDPDTQKHKEVIFADHIDKELLNSTMHIQAEGKVENNALMINNLNIDEQSLMNQFMVASTVNVRNIVYVRVNFSNGQQSQLSESGVTAHHNRTNQQYYEGSWGYLQFDNDPDADGNPEIFSITLNSGSSWCSSGVGLDTFVPQARSEILNDYGVDINTFDNIVLITPNMSSTCGGLGGYAEFGSPSTSQTMRAIIVRLFASSNHSVVIPHEIGHTMGLAHAANNSQTYGDDSSVMGNGSSIGFKTMSMNAVNVDELQGFRNYQNRIGTVQSGFYTIYPLRVDPAMSDGPQALRFLLSKTIYLSFRTAVGLDANLTSSYLNQVSFHEKGTSLAFDSQIKKTIELGETYNNSNGISVKLNEIGPGNAWAKVEVTVNGVPANNANNPAPVANDQVVVVKHNDEVSYSLDYNDDNYGPGPYTYRTEENVVKGSQTGSGVYKTYQAPSNFIGTDTYKWSMNDDDKDSNEGTVTVKVLQPGEPSDAFDNAVLHASFGADGKVTFNLDSGNASALSSCDMQFGDGSSNESCAPNKQHIYADGDYEACALLEDSQSKVMIACTQFSIVDGGEAINNAGEMVNFVNFKACQSSTQENATGLLFLIAFVLLINAGQTIRLKRNNSIN
ncbi:hypothetical protein MRY82_00355 [bacterium]|nr:hypothetical protein [bacterium]